MGRPRKKRKHALETKFLDDGRVEFKYLGEVDKDAIGNIDYSFHEKNDEYVFTDYFGSRVTMELYQAAVLKNSLKEIQENKKALRSKNAAEHQNKIENYNPRITQRKDKVNEI